MGLRDAELAARRHGDDLGKIGAHAATVRAQHLDAATNQAGNLDRRRGSSRRNANDHRPTAVPGHHEGVLHRLRASQHFDSDINPLAVREGGHAVNRIDLGSIYGVCGTEAAGGFQLVVTYVHRDDLPGAERPGDLNHVGTHAARTYHGNGVTAAVPVPGS